MIFRLEAADLEALAEAMEPVMERVVVRALRSPKARGAEQDLEVRYLTRQEVAKAFGISARSVDRYEELGRIPPRRQLGRRTVRWLEHEVREAVLKVPGSSEAPPSKVD